MEEGRLKTATYLTSAADCGRIRVRERTNRERRSKDEGRV